MRPERVAAALSILAAAIHGAVGPAHFAEWWGYGLFFTAAACAQLLFGLLLITHGLEIPGRTWDDVRVPVYWAGIAGNLAIIALWVVSRTYGIPWFGPHAGEVEAVGVIDVVSKVLELALIVVLAALLRRAHDEKGGPPRPGDAGAR